MIYNDQKARKHSLMIDIKVSIRSRLTSVSPRTDMKYPSAQQNFSRQKKNLLVNLKPLIARANWLFKSFSVRDKIPCFNSSTFF